MLSSICFHSLLLDLIIKSIKLLLPHKNEFYTQFFASKMPKQNKSPNKSKKKRKSSEKSKPKKSKLSKDGNEIPIDHILLRRAEDNDNLEYVLGEEKQKKHRSSGRNKKKVFPQTPILVEPELVETFHKKPAEPHAHKIPTGTVKRFHPHFKSRIPVQEENANKPEINENGWLQSTELKIP